MHCTKCGEEIEANHLFCNNCGTKIDNNIVSFPKSKDENEQQKDENSISSSATEPKIDNTVPFAPIEPKVESGVSFSLPKTYHNNTISSVICPSFMERIFASLIDTILHIIIMVILISHVPFYIILILILFYNAFMECSVHGGSLGKVLLNIYFADSEGSRLDFKKAFVHSLLRILSCLFPPIFFFAMNNKCETFHDKIAGCVTRKRLPTGKH